MPLLHSLPYPTHDPRNKTLQRQAQKGYSQPTGATAPLPATALFPNFCSYHLRPSLARGNMIMTSLITNHSGGVNHHHPPTTPPAFPALKNDSGEELTAAVVGCKVAVSPEASAMP